MSYVQVLSASEQGGSLTAMRVFRSVLKQQGACEDGGIAGRRCCVKSSTSEHAAPECRTVWSTFLAHGNQLAINVLWSSYKLNCNCAGARGFAAGLAPRLLTIVPGNMISWIVYEKMKQALG